MNCLNSDECPFLYECLSSICTHKNLFPLTPIELLTIFILCFASVISTVGGLGGGIFFFPIVIAILRIDPKAAVAISLTSVAGILTIRYIMSIPERHLRRNKPLINYDISIIYCPSIIIGTIFGVLLNKSSPNWLILTLVSVSMCFSFKETLKKGNKFRAEELEKENKNKNKFVNLNDLEMNHIRKIHECLLDSDSSLIDETYIINSKSSSLCIPKERIRYTELESDVIYVEPEKNLSKSFLRKCEKSLFTILEEESKIVPMKKLYILLVNMLILTIFACLQGNKTTHSLIGLEYCSIGYWFLQFLYIPFGLGILLFSVRLLNKEYTEKVNSGYLFLPSDIKWDQKTALTSIIIGLFIGFAAAILGAGGAIISGPVLLRMGFHPQEATYTASFMATFTAVAGAIQYIIAGMVKWDYTLMCFFIGIFGLFVGMNYAMKYIKRQNKASLIIFCLTGCIGFSTLVLIFSGIEKTVEDINFGRIFKLKEIC